MSNSSLIDAAKELLDLLKTNIRFIFITSSLFLFLGVIYSFSLSPKFEVYAEILPKENENLAIQQNNSLVNMLAQNNQQSDLSFFQSKLYSSAVAKILWDMGYDETFFSSAFNETSNAYEFHPSFWQKIKSKILGYEINTIIDHQNLSDFIEGSFMVQSFKNKPSSFLIGFQQDPQQHLILLQDLLQVTDDQIKADKLERIKGRIEFLAEKIRITNEVTVQTNLMLLLERTLLEEVLLSDESFYSIVVIDEPQISKNPSFINLQYIYIGFLLLGFFISIIYLYIRKFFFSILH